MHAALDILTTDGVLSGLSLADVAANAGVARGNIYNYYGSRRELLRHALNVRFAQIAETFADPPPPFVERKLQFIGGERERHSSTEMLALLIIDGDHEAVAMPFLERVMEGMHASVAAGDIHTDNAHDLEALHIAFSAVTRGYNLFRSAYARQIGVPIEELDQRVQTVIEVWLRQMAHPTPKNTAQPQNTTQP